MSTTIDLDNLQPADRAFLKQITEDRNRIVYIKLTLLDRNSQPIDNQTLIGTPAGGSINIEGNSSIRRSCNLTMVSNDVNLKENDWVYKKRFKVEIGLENHINNDYENIIWFSQGEFIITQFSSSIGVNNCNISISGQDKMCLLNGEAGGILTAETDFGVQNEYNDEGILTTTEVPLETIIKNIMMEYGGELEDNIELDLPTESAYELLEYRGNTPVYIIYNKNKKQGNDGKYYPDPVNITLHGDQPCWEDDNTETTLAMISSYWKPENELPTGAQQGEEVKTLTTGTDISLSGIVGSYNYKVQKVEYGEIAGYRAMPLIAANELVGAIGEPVSNILDKIRNQLGDYEYYYKLNGKFYFGPKKTYLKTGWNGSENISVSSNEEYAYLFNDMALFTSFSDSPDIKNIKNDYTVWGTRKSINGSVPIHERIAIDEKPTNYVSFRTKKTEINGTTNYTPDIKEYHTGNSKISSFDSLQCDWRELIYQMARDYMDRDNISKADYSIYGTANTYFELLQQFNTDLAANGRTGYEQYYTDLLGFWRQLYYPDRPVSYDPANYNDETNRELYIYKWEHPTALEDLAPSDLFVAQEIGAKTYYLPWIECINLSQNSGDDILIKNLYQKASQSEDGYVLLLNGSQINSTTCYYYQSGSGEYKTLDDYAWNNASENILQQLYYKKLGSTNTEPFIKRIDAKYLVDSNLENRQFLTSMKASIYINDVLTIVDIVSGISSIADVINKIKTKQSLTFQYVYNELTQQQEHTLADGESILFLEKVPRIDASNYTVLYWDEMGKEYKSYAKFLYDDEIFDELSLYTIKNKSVEDEGAEIISYWNLLEQKSYDRNNLYYVYKTEGEGENEKKYYKPFNEIFKDTSSNFSKQWVLLSGIDTLWIKSKEIDTENPITGSRPQFETYYKTNWKGKALTDVEYKRLIQYYKLNTEYYGNIVGDIDKSYWNRMVFENPELLYFWFDFIDPRELENNDLEKYSCKQIGTRNLAKNETNVRAIYYLDAPAAKYGTQNFQIPASLEPYFSRAASGISAHEEIDTLLYNHTYITESISISSVPIYHLNPNTKIKVIDEEHDIEDDYIVERLTIPLTYNGMMSISATKAPKKQ